MEINISLSVPELHTYCGIENRDQKIKFIMDNLVKQFDTACERIGQGRRMAGLAEARTESHVERDINTTTASQLKDIIFKPPYSGKEAVNIEHYIKNHTKYNYNYLIEQLLSGRRIHEILGLDSPEILIALANSVAPGGATAGGSRKKTKQKPKKKPKKKRRTRK